MPIKYWIQLLILLLAVSVGSAQPPHDHTSNGADPSTTLVLTTTPSNVRIFLDSVYIGTSPLSIDSIGHKRVRLGFMKEEFFPVEFLHQIPQDSVQKRIHVTLFSKTGFLTIHSEKGAFTCVVDDSIVIEGPFTSCPLSTGGHRLELRDHETARRFSTEIVIGPGQETVSTVRFKYPSMKNLLWSALIPGAASFHEGDSWEGAAILAANSASALAAAMMNRSFQRAKDRYQTEYGLYHTSQTETQGVEHHGIVQTAIDEVERTRRPLNVAIGVFAACYLANLVDAALFHGFDDALESQTRTPDAGSGVMLYPSISQTDISLNLYVNF